MDNLERFAPWATSFVSRVESLEDVHENGGEDSRRNAHPRSIGGGCQAMQGFAVDVLHHEEQLTRKRHDIENGHHVRMADRCGDPRLIDEHRNEGRLLCKLRVEPLDRHGAPEAYRPDEACEMDGGHSARRDFAEEEVPTDDKSP